ncbi:CSG1/SUR1-like protein [Neofusicoccum ribis]|uniref:CSG1/SUR1-like protein n=1 Tax=Neofusicoccum ribis TaxID=45134 RepID=A0ABR3T2U5_9PEZI
MEYVRLGQSGLKISKVVLGCMSYGDPAWQPWILDEAASLPLLKHAYDLGVNTWDVADTYSNGRSEEIVGKALRHYAIPRSRVVILSKCNFFVDEDGGPIQPAELASNEGERVNRCGLSRKHILDAVDRSVERLGTYIDVLQIHRLDRDVPMEEIMKALNDVVESGKVRYIGASSMCAWEFQMLQNVAARNGWHRFVSMQGYYNLLYREDEREMMPYCRATGVGLLPWSPLGVGVLTHPWDAETSAREKADAFLPGLIMSHAGSAEKAIVDRVQQVAEKRGVSMAQVATAWVMCKGAMPVMGLLTKEHMDQAVEAASLALSEEEIKFLEEPYLAKPVIVS